MHRLAMAILLLQDVFTGLLPSNGCPIVGCALVGTCLPIRFLETAKPVTIYCQKFVILDSKYRGAQKDVYRL
jgi:hypothetical protein